MATKRSLTFDEKYRLVLHLQRYPTLSDAQVKTWIESQFKAIISRSTIYRIKAMPIEQFAKVNLDAKRIRQVKYPYLESKLYSFYQRHDGTAILTDDKLLLLGNSILPRKSTL